MRYPLRSNQICGALMFSFLLSLVFSHFALPQEIFQKGMFERKPLPPRSKAEQQKLKAFRQALEQLFAQPSMQHVLWGVRIESLSRKEVLFKQLSEKNFIPASNQKLLTVAAALTYLDTAFQYTTNVFARGRLERLPDHTGVLQGDLIVTSNGNPCLSGKWLDPQNGEMGSPTLFFEAVADSLLSAGIRIVKGNLIGDDSAFKPSPLSQDWFNGDGEYATGLEWDDLSYGMAAPISALSFNENAVWVQAFPADTVGKPPVIVLLPPTGFVSIQNYATTSAKNTRRTLLISRIMGTNTIVISGELPITQKRGYSEKISIERPAMFFLTVLLETLAKKGIRIEGEIRRKHTAETFIKDSLRLIAQYRSPSLMEILTYLQKESSNYLSEQVLRTVGAAYQGGGKGSLEAGLQAMRKVLSVAGAKPEEFLGFDGSGLSRKNRISPDAILSLLRWFYHSSKFETFLKTLAIAGFDGTMLERLRHTKAEKRVFAKTGYLSGVRTISGYLYGENGEWFAFSLMAMNYTQARRDIEELQDKVLELLADFAAKATPASDFAAPASP
ncbi:MAG: D-alanyl-D-alanine carboxypeptidase/D-alanyl-D-alanine-endopeptidase [Chloroherpetonaceae bacterium]|nr:D-alanyl-D-alanine carboxypeptidase/D-alanyl-D-alanine-endopeptidase [Chloroherpetonaceae bacterium]